jgi:hypothetical protein
MKELKAIFALLVLLVGGFVLYKVVPVFWADYRLGQMVEQQAIIYTYQPKSDPEIPKLMAEKAQDLGVELSPEQIKVDRSGAGLAITAAYSVHVDLPVFPFDLHFTTGTHNKNVMK